MAEKVTDHSKLDTEVKVKKTRASKPKVKTGCQTCKFVFAIYFNSHSLFLLVCSLVWRGGSSKVEEYIAKLVQHIEYGASSAMRPSPAAYVA
jgi:hypothetical protein